MPLLRSFGILPYAIYKDTAPLGLGKGPPGFNSTPVGQRLGLPKNDFPDPLSGSVFQMADEPESMRA